MYTFELKEYRAVKSARIRLDGITVLAGINGSGKSTLSRWLSYIVNATHNFELHQRHYFIESLELEIEKVHRVFRGSPKGSYYQSVRNQLRRFKFENEQDWDSLKDLYYSFVQKAEEDLREYEKIQPNNRRLISYLYGESLPEGIEKIEIIDSYIEECRNAFEKGLIKYLHKIETCSKDDLEQIIMSEYSEGDRIPKNVLLIEREIPLLENNTFSQPLMLSRAIYIDSPMTVSGTNFFRSVYPWGELHYYLYKDNSQKSDVPFELFNMQIQSIIGGDIKLTDDKFGIEKELHYISKEQGIDINVNDVATGIKTFAYMSQLLANGWLDKETLLLIDEPEAHLHPQWIVEFARLLVRIHKKLGVKILVASHNPDMVAAIQSIAHKEEVLDKTVFYLAEKEKEGYQYEFTDKGTDISDIFASFNIAISRIEMYGSTVI